MIKRRGGKQIQGNRQDKGEDVIGPQGVDNLERATLTCGKEMDQAWEQGNEMRRWGKGGSDKMQLMLVSILTLKTGIDIDNKILIK